jgi:hypothetical protein
LAKKGKKCADLFFFKLRGNPLFVPSFGVHSVPVQSLRRESQRNGLQCGFDKYL